MNYYFRERHGARIKRIIIFLAVMLLVIVLSGKIAFADESDWEQASPQPSKDSQITEESEALEEGKALEESEALEEAESLEESETLDEAEVPEEAETLEEVEALEEEEAPEESEAPEEANDTSNEEEGVAKDEIQGTGESSTEVLADAEAEVTTNETNDALPATDGEDQDIETDLDVSIVSSSQAMDKETKSDYSLKRLAGSDRYDTAIRIADELKATLGIKKFTSIVVASGETYPDALSGAYLANQNNSPILLVSPKNTNNIVTYIKSNLEKSGEIFILGGTGAVSDALDKKLTSYKVSRVAGKDRFETNLAVLRATKAGENSSELLICSGLNYPDALSAASTGKPILLVGKTLNNNQKKYLSEFNKTLVKYDSTSPSDSTKGSSEGSTADNPKEASANKSGTSAKAYYVIGGTLAVSGDVEKVIKTYGVTKRISGANKYETSVAIAKEFSDGTEKGIMLASGKNFPDGLAGGPLAVAKDMMLVLADNEIPVHARNYGVDSNLHDYVILGGEALIDSNIAKKIASPDILRISGNKDNISIKTADEIKSALKIDKFDTIVVASGEKYPDGLSGTHLAAQKKAPILLTTKSNQGSIIDYIKENIVENGLVYILGGNLAVSQEVDKALEAIEELKLKVKRIFGNDRFDTNLAVLKETGIGKADTEILVCSGENYPDALSASAVNKPILLVGNHLTPAQKTFLKSLGKKTFHVIGGSTAVSENIDKELKTYGTTDRIAGDNRYETSTAIAQKFFGGKIGGVIVTTGSTFGDALVGSVLAAVEKVPLILADNNKTVAIGSYLGKTSINSATLLGTEKALGSDVLNTHVFLNMGKYISAFESNGKISASKWIDDSGKRYYALPEGIIVTDRVFMVDGSRYGANSKGELQKGFVKIKGKEYYFTSSYAMPTKMKTSYTQNFVHSPNYYKGRNGYSIETIVIHHWGGDEITFSSVINTFVNWRSEVSAHYVAQHGRVTQMVYESDRAWHAGSRVANATSIGIECRPAKTSGDLNTVAELVCDIWVRNGEIIPISEHREHASTLCPGRWSSDEVYRVAKRLLAQKATV